MIHYQVIYVHILLLRHCGSYELHILMYQAGLNSEIQLEDLHSVVLLMVSMFDTGATVRSAVLHFYLFVADQLFVTLLPNMSKLDL